MDEHSKLPFEVEKYNRWKFLNDEGKYCVFVTPIAHQFEDTSPDTGFSIEIDDGLMYINTHELGKIRINSISGKTVNKLLSLIEEHPNHFFLYPQVIVDKETGECYLRSVFTRYRDRIQGLGKLDKLNAYRNCPYVKTPEEFFREYAGFMVWPSP